MSATIRHVDAIEVLDSRGNPTVRATVTLSDGSLGTAAAPSGASTGAFEAHELRDGDPARYRGLGVQRAVANVRGELARCAQGRDAMDQAGLDGALAALDGTPNKKRLGANAILAVSMATAVAAARHAGLPLYRYLNTLAGAPPLCLPLPMINLFSGGKHAGAQVDFQDFLIVPGGARSVARALEMAHAVFYTARDLLRERHGYQPLVADEGGWAPRLPSNEAMLEAAVAAIERAGLRPLKEVAIAVDVAATHFHREGRYRLAVEGRELAAEEMIARLEDWCRRYPILSIEDGLAEDDWANWPALTRAIGARCQVLGDDLFATHPQRIRRGIACGAANSVLIKVNQIGTLTEALEAIRLARSTGWNTVVSARSGETEDAWLADLAVGTGAGQIKVGAITRSERLAKYNRLLAIAHEAPELPFACGVLDRFATG
jgi:enolase